MKNRLCHKLRNNIRKFCNKGLKSLNQFKWETYRNINASIKKKNRSESKNDQE